MSSSSAVGWPRRVLFSSWPAMLATLAALTVALSKTGVSTVGVVTYFGYLVVAITLPGVFVWRLLLRRQQAGEESPTWFEDLTFGTIFGFGVQLPFFLAGVALGASWLIWLPPLAAIVLSLTPSGRRSLALPRGRLDPRASWALGAVILCGALALARDIFPRRPLGLQPRLSGNIDETFHQALIADIANRFPPEIPFLLGTRLDYHWFVHAQIAASNSVTGLDSVVMLRQLMPAVSLVLGVLGLAAVALRLTGRPFAAFLAPALLVGGAFHLLGPDFPVGGYIEPYVMAWRFASPSQSYGVMISMTVLMLTLEVLRPGHRATKATWFALGVSLFVLGGAKATFLPIFLCGAVGVWGLRLLLVRKFDRTLSALVALVIGVTVLVQIVLFGGQTGGMTYDPLMTPERMLETDGLEPTSLAMTWMTGTMLVAWLMYGAGVFGLARERRWLDPRTIWLVGAIAAGVAVPLLLFRSGGSQLWFSRSAAELIALVSAWGMAVLLPRPMTARRLLVFGGAAVGSGLLAALVSAALGAQSETPRKVTITTMAATTLAPFVILAVFGLVWVLFRGVRRRRTTSIGILLSVLLGLGLSNVWVLAHEQLTEPALQRSEFSPLFARGGAEAAGYITEHSGPDDVVATNVHCVRPNTRKCDNRSFWVSAYTKRRIVVQGWGYTAALNASAVPGTANRFLPIPDPGRLKVNDAAFLDPSPETVTELVDRYGVDWFFVSKKHPADLQGLAELPRLLDRRFENTNYVVYEVS